MDEILVDWKSRLTAIAAAGNHHLNRVWHVASTLLADYPQADAMAVRAASQAAKKFAADYPFRARRQYGE